MPSFADESLRDFLDALAAGEPTPGGGAAAALAGSQAAALLVMALNFAVGRDKYAAVAAELNAIRARAQALRAELLELVDRDAAAYGAVAACFPMPKFTPQEKEARRIALETAMRGAAEVPLLVAERCLELIRLAEPVGRKGNPSAAGDVTTGVYLALAGLNSALLNVEINLTFIRDESFVTGYGGKVAELRVAAADAYTSTLAALSSALGVAL